MKAVALSVDEWLLWMISVMTCPVMNSNCLVSVRCVRIISLVVMISMLEVCSDCEYNVDEYCIMFDDVLGFEDCVFRSVDDE